MKHDVLEARKLAAAAVASGHGDTPIQVPLWLADMVNRPLHRGHVRADLLAAACEDLLARNHEAWRAKLKQAFAKAGEVDHA